MNELFRHSPSIQSVSSKNKVAERAIAFYYFHVNGFQFYTMDSRWPKVHFFGMTPRSFHTKSCIALQLQQVGFLSS